MLNRGAMNSAWSLFLAKMMVLPRRSPPATVVMVVVVVLYLLRVLGLWSGALP
jgi:hypothetical protein